MTGSWPGTCWVSDLLKLRDYQSATIRALHTRWDAGDRRVAAVLPTGAGKTVVFSHLSSGFVADNPGRRVLILAHTDELVSQAVKKLRDVAPHLRVGVVKASRNDVRAQVIVASVQSLRSEKRRNQIRNVGLVIVDECHHAAATTYRKILEHYGCMAGEATSLTEGQLPYR
jgi:superfamily II DNA or RNA helicase